ncbi:DUF2750 domain-containing protein [Aliagarivorans taiwanensis]|uniref:DUF2750 domain-containing protein n=1 Tax=Aliagarivorans taiwanensis TaxID=561966 RepID=UPI00040B6345|nr:DUF2750 domain-containing protein [Aliagarivorans taiwanensis]
MSQTTLEAFAAEVIETGVLWLLSSDEDYLVIDSIDFEDTDVLPVFSSESAAKALCTEDWAEYSAQKVDLNDFFEEWLPSLDEDGVMVGVDFDEMLKGDEVEAFTLGKALADQEAS